MNIKALIEKRSALLEELQGMIATCEAEARGFNEDEAPVYTEKMNEVERLNQVIDAARALPEEKEEVRVKEPEKETQEEMETRAFEEYVRGVVSERTNNLTPASGSGQVLIPATIANKIIAKVYDICPVLAKSTKYNVKGTLNIPYYDEGTHHITVDYQSEFSPLGSNVGDFTTISLTGYLAGALALVSRSLINNTEFNIVAHVVNYMAEAIARFIEKELLIGTSSPSQKVAGLKAGITLQVTAAAQNAITADELIQLQDKVKDAFQKNACWIMSPATRTALRLLKDKNDRYLLQDDVTAPFGHVLLGKPVYVSDNMPDMAHSAVPVYYGDLSGLATKFNEQISIDVLREHYADQHAVGVIAWFEFDGKVENAQKLAKLVMA